LVGYIKEVLPIQQEVGIGPVALALRQILLSSTTRTEKPTWSAEAMSTTALQQAMV